MLVGTIIKDFLLKEEMSRSLGPSREPLPGEEALPLPLGPGSVLTLAYLGWRGGQAQGHRPCTPLL